MKIFLYLVKKRFSLEMIEGLAPGIKIPIFEILRDLRENLSPEWYQDLPKSGYRLIARMDIYKNMSASRVREQVPLYLRKTDLSEIINNIIRGNSRKGGQDDFQGQSQQPSSHKNSSSTKHHTRRYGSGSGQRFGDSQGTTLTQNLQNENDMIFEEVNRLLDTGKDIKIPAKFLEAVPEEKLEAEA
jgi:hypothetical protein